MSNSFFSNHLTLADVLKLVTFYQDDDGIWHIADVHGDVAHDVKGDVHGDVKGDVHCTVHGSIRGDVHGSVCGDVHCTVCGNIHGNIGGDVKGDVYGDVNGEVVGTIQGRDWQLIETPAEKLQRLIKKTGNLELIAAFNDLEDSNG